MSIRKPVLVVAIAAMLLFGGSAFGQVDTSGTPDLSEATLAFAGARSNDGVFAVSFGFGKPISGSLYLFQYVDAGYTGTWSSEIAYVFKPLDKLYVGPIAGPNVDWGSTADKGASPLTYLTGAAGALVGYELLSWGGAWGYGKYKFALEEAATYRDGYAFGGGLFVWF